MTTRGGKGGEVAQVGGGKRRENSETDRERERLSERETEREKARERARERGRERERERERASEMSRVQAPVLRTLPGYVTLCV